MILSMAISEDFTKASLMRRMFLLLITITMMFIYSNCHAATTNTQPTQPVVFVKPTNSNDSTNVSGSTTRSQLKSIMRPEKSYFLLDSGFQGPGRPAAGKSYWYGDTKAENSVKLTGKKCPVGYTPSVKLAFINSDEGGGTFYGNYVLQAAFDTNTYSLYNIEAYSNKLTRNGTITFRWDLFCKAS